MFAVGCVDANPNSVADLELADTLVRTFSRVQTSLKSKLFPEKLKFHEDSEFSLVVDEYMLRPEAIESIYVM
jgi:hypothetical protein